MPIATQEKKELLIKKALNSKILDPRQKWAFIKYIRDNELEDLKIYQLSVVFDHEDDIIKDTEKKNIQRLKEYNAKLEEIIKVELPKKRKLVEEKERVVEEKELEGMMEELKMN